MILYYPLSTVQALIARMACQYALEGKVDGFGMDAENFWEKGNYSGNKLVKMEYLFEKL